MAQSSDQRGNSLVSMDPFDFWEHPNALLRGAEAASGVMKTPPRVPAAEVSRDNGNLVITVELPGLAAEDVKLEAIGNLLTVQGERRPERGPEVQTRGPKRRRYFYREFVLPEGADGKQARAEMDRGILRIVVPLRSQPQQVPVVSQFE
jgi:HSP20 family molecular chaperone IbpA